MSEKLDLSEKGVGEDGQPISSDRRLFMQFLAFGGCKDARPVGGSLERGKIRGAVYSDINDPQGVGVLIVSEDPGLFSGRLRTILGKAPFTLLHPKPELSMLGRTYAIGYETDLDHALIHRPMQRITNPAFPWAVWYPLRRRGSFARLPEKEQRSILMEHGAIGSQFGQADLAHDVRLAAYGLDQNDNDFVIGLLGRDLHPLSALVQAMRKTRQTSEYIERMGPFFVGHVAWQSPPEKAVEAE